MAIQEPRKFWQKSNPCLRTDAFLRWQCWSTCMNEFYYLTQKRRRCLLLPVWFTSQLESFLLLEKKQLSSLLPSSLCTKRKNATFNILLWPASGSLPVQAQVLLSFTLIWCFSALGIRSVFKYRETHYLNSWEALEPCQATSPWSVLTSSY